MLIRSGGRKDYYVVATQTLGSLRKPRRQRERCKTRALLSKTIAVHVRYNSWYIFCRRLQNMNLK